LNRPTTTFSVNTNRHVGEHGHAFTLLELLVVIAIIALVAALLVPTIARSKAAAKKTVCINNVRQINLAVHAYADDHLDAFLAVSNSEPVYVSYKESVQPYLLHTDSTSPNQLFSCPADNFNCDDPAIKNLFSFWNPPPAGKSFFRQATTHYSSYAFNGQAPDASTSRMAQKAFASVREPSRVVLICELSGAFGLSAHDRKEPYQYNNARAVLSFVDTHVSYVPIYWNGINGFDGISAFYEPPAGYDYKWSE
jgi:prepilin-type N-terminal cleavage/methylation domain-containing protein